MKREEAKQLLPVIQAYAEGKEMQLKNDGVWIDAKYQIPFDNITSEDIRIKPEPIYRPFKNAEECWQEMQKHQPFGWVIAHPHSDTPIKENLTLIGKSVLQVHSGGTWDIGNAFQILKFADGTPFGIIDNKED